MKKRICILTGMLLVSMLLTACMNKNNIDGQAASGTNTSASGSQTAEGSAANGGASGSDSSASGSDSSASGSDSSVSGSDSSVSGSDSSASGSDSSASGGDSSASGGDSSVSGGDNALSAEHTYDAENQIGAESAAQWEGTFVSESGETLSLQERDEYTLSIAFANAGISGLASKEGSEAYFDGDDDNVVCFVQSGNSVTVSVVNAEGYSTEGSPLIGVYIRQ